MADNKKILVGKIVAPQGIRGCVRVKTYTENPLDFNTLNVISDKFNNGDFRFVRVVPSSKVIIAKINGVNDRNTAETLRGTELFVARDTLPPAADGEYYQADLIGFYVVRDEIKLGAVTCFQNFGAGDIIELDNGDMVSFNGAKVDFENKTIYVR